MSLLRNALPERTRNPNAPDWYADAVSYARNPLCLRKAPAAQNLAHGFGLDSKARRNEQGVLSDRVTLPNLDAIGKRQNGSPPRATTRTDILLSRVCHIAKPYQIAIIRPAGKRDLAAVPPVAKCGGGGIRTHGTLQRPTEPKSAALTTRPPRLRVGARRVREIELSGASVRRLHSAQCAECWPIRNRCQVYHRISASSAPPSSGPKGIAFSAGIATLLGVGRGGAPLKKDRTLVQGSSVRTVPHPAGTS